MADDSTVKKPKPVLVILACLFNGFQLVMSAIFAGLWFRGTQCQRGEVNPNEHNYAAFGVVYSVCFLVNLIFGLFIYRKIRYRSRTLSFFQLLKKLLTKTYALIAYLVFLLFELIWAVVMVTIIPQDAACALREGPLLGLGIALGYMLIIAVIGFFLGVFINMVFGWDRKFDDEASDNDDDDAAPKAKPKKVAAAPVDDNDVPPTNPFADEPASAPAAEADEDAPPPVAPKKSSKKTAEELADEEWNAKVRQETGGN